MAYNPFSVLPITLCDALDLPAFAQCQDTTTYVQLRSQVGGILILPDGATGPDDWEAAVDWAGVVDNSTTDNSSAKYLVGRGSFLPNGVTELSLSGGRLVQNRERLQRLAFNLVNTNDGHADFARKLQNNVRNFSVWVQTIGDRIIGGETGMRPIYVNSDFIFSDGNDDREVIAITMDFTFEHFPAMTSMSVDLNGTPIDPGAGPDCNCDVQSLLNDLSTYNSDADAAAGSVAIGEFYIAGPGHDRAPWGTVTTRLF